MTDDTLKRWYASTPLATTADLCCCIGPQNGEPRCPCAMKGIIIRDGRYIKPEEDLGPVRRIVRDELAKGGA